MKRFKTECQAVALLSHPNIVSVYDVGVAFGAPYIVMELIEGITLKEYINQRAPLKYTEAIHFTSQILRALEHAHSRNIVHRDIKPQNIMVLENGTIKVADFGIARFTMSNTVTITDDAIGTVHYLSPEQAKGSVAVEASDVYSVGVILYEMLTGKVPYDADNPVSVAMMHLSASPIPPRKLNPLIPEGLEEITLKAMARNQTDRYTTASAMLRDLEVFKKDPAIHFEYKKTFDQQPTQYWKQTDIREKYQKHGNKKRSPDEANTKTPFIAGAAAAVLVSLIGIFVFFKILAPSPSTEETDITVPDFTNQVYEDVIKNQEYSEKFNFELKQEIYDKEVPAGNIISQKPSDKMVVKKGSTISLVVSRGPQTAVLPDFYNVEYRSAVLALKSMDVSYELIFEENAEITQGHIFKTSPEADSEIKDNMVVKLYISNGVEVKYVKVPNVVGKTQDEAKHELELKGLIMSSNNKYVESSESSGTVISQNKLADTEVEEGSEVILEISKGSASKTYTLSVQLPQSDSPIEVMVFMNDRMIYSGKEAGGSTFTLPITYTESMYIELFTGNHLFYSDKVLY